MSEIYSRRWLADSFRFSSSVRYLLVNRSHKSPNITYVILTPLRMFVSETRCYQLTDWKRFRMLSVELNLDRDTSRSNVHRSCLHCSLSFHLSLSYHLPDLVSSSHFWHKSHLCIRIDKPNPWPKIENILIILSHPTFHCNDRQTLMNKSESERKISEQQLHNATSIVWWLVGKSWFEFAEWANSHNWTVENILNGNFLVWTPLCKVQLGLYGFLLLSHNYWRCTRMY